MDISTAVPEENTAARKAFWEACFLPERKNLIMDIALSHTSAGEVMEPF